MNRAVPGMRNIHQADEHLGSEPSYPPIKISDFIATAMAFSAEGCGLSAIAATATRLKPKTLYGLALNCRKSNCMS